MYDPPVEGKGTMPVAPAILEAPLEMEDAIMGGGGGHPISYLRRNSGSIIRYPRYVIKVLVVGRYPGEPPRGRDRR